MSVNEEGQNLKRLAVEADVNQDVLESFQHLLADLRHIRPAERSERSRRYAVTITEVEKVASYFKVMIADYVFEE